jgi:prepilin-type N-terminal cleavage/methylation domain-containing protein
VILKRVHPDPGHAAAFTLIELLAVIVIVSMVAGTATVGLAATSEWVQLHAAAAQWRDLDARGRLLGRSLGSVVMSLDEGGDEIRLVEVRSDEVLSSVLLPRGVTGRIHAPKASQSVVFDHLGRTIDYQVELRSNDRVVGWQVHGMTGLMTEDEP